MPRATHWSLVATVGVVLVAVSLAGSPCLAATFIVNSTLDKPDTSPGNGVCATGASVCTLRAAIQEANALAGNDLINVPAGTFSLDSFLEVSSGIEIAGNGAKTTLIDGGGTTSLFRITAAGSLAIQSCTLRGGKGSGYPGAVSALGPLKLIWCAIVENQSSTNGGAISVGGTTTTISHCLIDSNKSGGHGGAISISSQSANVSISNSTISANTAARNGGAIHLNRGILDLAYVTIVENVSGAAKGGGAIAVVTGTVTIGNSIVNDNTDVSNPTQQCSIEEDGSWIRSMGRNIFGSSQGCNLSGATSLDMIGIDPLLAGLGDNGGPTRTYALQAGSPAIDGGDPAYCGEYDQRSKERVEDGDGDGIATPDIGAFEYSGSVKQGEPFFVPSTANVAGANNTTWRTDLEIHNKAAVQASYVVALLEWNKQNTAPQQKTYTLGPGKSIRYGNALKTIFDFTGQATLRITPRGGSLQIMSNTYNDDAAGTYGQPIPGLPRNRALHAGDVARLIQLTQSASTTAGQRTNLGLINASNKTIRIKAEFYAASGSKLGTASYELRPWESKQIGKVFTTVTTQEVVDGYIVVTSDTAGAEYFVCAHAIDNKSGDPLYVVAQ
jgi:CSLREA domain-containing protein